MKLKYLLKNMSFHDLHFKVEFKYFKHQLIFCISNLHIPDLYTHNGLHYILCFCTLPICILYFYDLGLVLLHCRACHYNKFLVCVNIPVQ